LPAAISAPDGGGNLSASRSGPHKVRIGVTPSSRGLGGDGPGREGQSIPVLQRRPRSLDGSRPALGFVRQRCVRPCRRGRRLTRWSCGSRLRCRSRSPRR
jgi:hypothetical protein